MTDFDSYQVVKAKLHVSLDADIENQAAVLLQARRQRVRHSTYCSSLMLSLLSLKICF